MRKRFFRKTLVYITTLTLIFTIFASLSLSVAGEEGEITIQDQIIESADEWFIEDSGTYFEIISNNYLDITISSSENVDVFLESASGFVSYHVEGDGQAGYSDITLSGFIPDTTYYMSQDDDESVAFTTDSSGIYSYTQDLSSGHLVTIQEDSSTIYISSDGNVYPTTAPISRSGDTYTLTNNVYERINIERSGIILDGAGYAVQGSGSDYGVSLWELENVVVKNLNIVDFWAGINMNYCSYITVQDNTISNAYYSIRWWDSTDITVSGNTLTSHDSNGVGINIYADEVDYSTGVISSNTISDASSGIYSIRVNDLTISGNTISSCTWAGIRPYRSGPKIIGNTISDNYGYGAYIDASDNIIFDGNTFTGNDYGILQSYYNPSNSITIKDNSFTSLYYHMYLRNHAGATIIGNSFFSSNQGISIYYSSDVRVSDNSFSDINYYSLSLYYTSDTIITDNVFNNVGGGINCHTDADNYIVMDNTITSIGTVGYSLIYLRDLTNSIVVGNTVQNGWCGFWVDLSVGNSIYHNNIIGNTYQVRRFNLPSNTWDNGAGEGNYWSDYTGLDDGSNGRTPGDGIGDTKIPHPDTYHSPNYYQLDNYPLMSQWIPVNNPPVADAGGPYTTNEGEEVTLDASGSTDPNYDLLNYRWDFNNDGVWDTDYLFSPFYDFLMTEDFSGTIKLEVSDDEYTSTDTTSLTINNVAPNVDPLPALNLNEGTVATFTGYAFDPGIDDLTFTWSWGDSSPNTVTTYISNDVSPMEITEIMTHAYGDNGVYTVTLTVQDDDGASNTVTTTVTVNNVDPGATILGGIGIADNYIFTANWYGFSWIMDILSDGSFDTPEFIDDKASGTYGVGIGDFDNDGDLDALLGDAYDTWYYEKLGPGNDFASAVSIESTYLGYRMDFAEADYNNDGNLDAIMASYGQTYFSVYMGNGDGSFSISTLNGPMYIIGMDSADFNNDGKMDFIASGYTYGPYIYMGNGDGTFQSPIILNFGYSWGVCADDFDNDGNDDIIFEGTFYPGNGDGTFGYVTILGISSNAIAESDINNDGNLDLVYTDYNNIYYMTGNGDGTFNHESTTWINYDMYSIAVCPETEGGGLEADEGELIDFDGTFSDLGWLDDHTAIWDWGDGTPPEEGIVTEENVEPMATGEVSGEYTYGDNDEFTVTLTVTDDDGGYGSDTITVTINNVAPTVNAGSDQIAFVGIPADFSGSFTDPGWLDTHTFEWNWGDGTPIDSGSLTPQHTFTDSGIFTVTLTVTDDDGGVGIDTITVTVYYPPVADAGLDQTVDEGDTVSFDATLSTGSYFVDSLITNQGFETGEFSGWTVYIPPGGSADVVTTHNGDMGMVYSPIDGSYFSLLKTDGAGSYTNVSQTFYIIDGVTIYGWAAFDARDYEPVYDNACVQILQEDFVVATPWYSDVIIVGDYGDGPWEEWSWTATSSGIYTLEYRVANALDSVYDSYAMFDSTIQTNIVNYPINSYKWDFDNDGTYDYQETTSNAPDGLFDGKTTYIYGDNNAYTVTVQVTDELGATDTDTCLITVNNVAPTITTLTSTVDPVQLGDPISADAEFTDPGFLDTHTASWDWGDGNTTSGIITGSGGTYTVNTESWTYGQPGVYTITLTVEDDDGGSDTMTFKYVVIYDPSAGFVTGGGWIMSPEGAYTPDPTLTGKANFGFVAKYKKGKSTPDGNTEFQFKVANMNFHSNDYDWLVIQIAGAKAMYKGIGTINGEGNYGFKITAIDEELTPSTDVDLFRIKIWDKDNNDEIIYDNQLGDEDGSDPTTQIGGGNIKIHEG